MRFSFLLQMIIWSDPSIILKNNSFLPYTLHWFIVHLVMVFIFVRSLSHELLQKHRWYTVEIIEANLCNNWLHYVSEWSPTSQWKKLTYFLDQTHRNMGLWLMSYETKDSEKGIQFEIQTSEKKNSNTSIAMLFQFYSGLLSHNSFNAFVNHSVYSFGLYFQWIVRNLKRTIITVGDKRQSKTIQREREKNAEL